MSARERVTMAFSSLTELGELLKSEEFNAQRFPSGSSSGKTEAHYGRPNFFGGLTRDQATQIAFDGGYYPEGAANMQPVDLDPAGFMALQPVDVWEQSQVGAFANVPAFLTGEPCAMFDQASSPQNVPFLSMAVVCGRLATTTAEAVNARGAAVLSIIDALTSGGVRVELDALWRNCDLTGAESDFRVRLKHADQQYDSHACAFALAHPAFNRRLMWRLCESQSGLHHMIGSYGNGMSADLSDYDVAVPYPPPHWGKECDVSTWIAHLLPSVKLALEKQGSST